MNLGGLLDPRSQAMLGAAQALTQAGAPSRVPITTSQALANAMAQGASNYRQAQAAGMKQQMNKMAYDAAILQAQNRKAFLDAVASGDQDAIRAAAARAYPGKMAEQIFAKPQYKERDYPLKSGMVQKQISQDGGRTWANSGEPYDRRNPWMPITIYDPQQKTVTSSVVDVRTIGAKGQEQPRVVTIGAKQPIRPSGEESKAIGFAGRMVASNKILDGLEDQGADMVQAVLSGVPKFGNFLITGERQRYEQAKRDFINAQLRRESGAAIAPHEFENANKQYFPVPGDEPETIAQKRANRITALQSMEAAAGVTYGGSSKLPPGAPKGAVLTNLEDRKNPGKDVYKWTDAQGRTRYWSPD
jgi:hypothetical protein